MVLEVDLNSWKGPDRTRLFVPPKKAVFSSSLVGRLARGDPPFVGHNSSRSPKRELDESRMTPVLPGMPEPEEEDDFVRNFILLRLFCLFFRLFLWLKQAGVLTKACSLACGRLWMAGFSCSLAFGYVSPFCRRRTPRTRIYGLPAHLGWLKGAEGGEF